MSDNDQKMTPMLETLLERINVLTTETRELRSLVEKGFAGIREEMNQGFRKMDRRLDVMGSDIYKLRADMQSLESQIEKFVEKVEQPA